MNATGFGFISDVISLRFFKTSASKGSNRWSVSMNDKRTRPAEFGSMAAAINPGITVTVLDFPKPAAVACGRSSVRPPLLA